MTNGRKPHRQHGLMSWIKSKLRRPGMFRLALAILNLINLVARFLDEFR
jgi:hypothetical protein